MQNKPISISKQPPGHYISTTHKVGLMNKGTWIEHGGKRIWSVDYSGLSGDDLYSSMDDTEKALIEAMELTGRKDALIFSDVSNMPINTSVLVRMHDGGNKINPYVSKAALMGLPEGSRLFHNFAINFTGLNIRVFKNRLEALDWLVE